MGANVGGVEAGLEAVEALGGGPDVGDVAAVGHAGDGEAAGGLESAKPFRASNPRASSIHGGDAVDSFARIVATSLSV